MKKIVLIMGLMVGITTISKAQIFIPEQRAKTLQAVLKLDEKQTVQITDFYNVLKAKMDSVGRAGATSDFKEEMAETKAKIKSVLTKKQNVAYEKWLIESAKRAPARRVVPNPSKQ